MDAAYSAGNSNAAAQLNSDRYRTAGVTKPASEISAAVRADKEDDIASAISAAAMSKEANEQLAEEVKQTDYIDEIATSYGLDPDIVRAVIEVESGGDPEAVGDGGESLGLMQIQPRWHGERMARLGVTDLLDPYQNVSVGCNILSELLQKYSTYEMALSAYNSGDPYGAPEYVTKVMDYEK